MTLHKLVFSYLVIVGLGFLFPLYAEEDSFLGVVARDEVNIRANNSVDSEVLGQLKKGESVEVRANEYGWFKIRLPREAKCFINKRFVKGDFITGDRVNLRAGPGINFSIIGKADKGLRVNVILEDGDWLRLTPPESAFGWVRSDMIRHRRQEVQPSREDLYNSLNVQVGVK